MNRHPTFLAFAALAALPAVALAGEPAGSAAAPPTAPATDLAAAVPGTAPKTVPTQRASDDVNYEIETMRPRPAGLLPRGPVSLLDPVFDDANAWMKEELRLEIGMAYTTVWQRASDGDIRDAAGGDADIFARWTLLGCPDEGNRGVLGATGEYRHDMGNYAPRDLGDDFGSLWRTVNGFGLQDAIIPQCWWEQHVLDDLFVVTLGKVDPDIYYNTNRYQSDQTTFMSRMFSNNPARNHPSPSLGGNVKWNVDPQVYVLAGLHDANGDKIHSGFGTIDEGEFFTTVELGWTPAFEERGKGAYRLNFWHSDERDDAGIPSDEGIGLSCEQEIGGGVVPFLRAGWSQGDVTGVQTFVGGGVGLEGLLGGKDDLTGIGIGWGDPNDGDLDSQWGAEVFHRFQLSPDIQLTVGYQYVLSPSYDAVAGDDPVGVFEIRVRFNF